MSNTVLGVAIQNSEQNMESDWNLDNVMTGNSTGNPGAPKKAINRGRWTKEEVREDDWSIQSITDCQKELTLTCQVRYDVIRFVFFLSQDEKLKRMVEIHGESWDFIASLFPDRADLQCQQRWQKVVNPDLVKGELKLTLWFPLVINKVLHVLLRTLDKGRR